MGLFMICSLCIHRRDGQKYCAVCDRVWQIVIVLKLGSLLTLNVHCCHMGTAIKRPAPDQVKPSFVIFDILAL